MERYFLLDLVASTLPGGIQPAVAQELPYFFTHFDATEGYAQGPLDADRPDFQLLQGAAAIARDALKPDNQWLETGAGDPYAAIFLTGNRIAAHGFSCLEFWTRPFASEPDPGEEFIDFNGSVLGFFRDGESGTLFACHSISGSDGFWISTGITVRLNGEGTARDWMRITVTQDLLRKTWDVSVNGSAALTGINHAATAPADTFELWFYGHETGSNRFDDVLISPLPPDTLEHALKSQLPRRTTPPAGAVTAEKRVGQSQPTQKRRNHHAPAPDPERRAALRVLDVDFDLLP